MKRLPFFCLLLLAVAVGGYWLQFASHSGGESPSPAVAAIPAPPPQVTTASGTIASERLGDVAYYLPAGEPTGVIILFTDPVHPEMTGATATALRELGAVVGVVDSAAYFKVLGAQQGGCLWLSSDIEALNRDLQHKLNFPEFRLPVLASLGESGALVEALLIEAPSYSFAGGVSTDFRPTIPLPLNFCGGPAVEAAQPPATGYTLSAQKVAAPWNLIPATGAEDAVADWLDGTDNVELMPLAKDGPLGDPVTALADAVKPMLAEAAATDPNSLKDLPLIEVPPEGAALAPGGPPQPYIAIIYSGDGGWRDLDRTLGQVLSAHGVPVVGVDSLLYFWQPKRPEIVAHDLERIIEHYRKEWHAEKVVLVGYSFGADIMPFAYNRLEPAVQADVAEVSLLGLSRNANFEISVEGYFEDAKTAASQPVEPELAKMPSPLVQCFYGEEEATESACTTPAGEKTEIIKTVGGHHFGDDYDALAMDIMNGAEKRLMK
jgi:type IV secretory pathway VirJ component